MKYFRSTFVCRQVLHVSTGQTSAEGMEFVHKQVSIQWDSSDANKVQLVIKFPGFVSAWDFQNLNLPDFWILLAAKNDQHLQQVTDGA